MTTLPVADRPSHTVSVPLDHHLLDRLDAIRMMDPDLPSRAELIKAAVILMLDLHEDPASAINQLVDGLADLFEDSSLQFETEITGAA
jgi:metal-responsive CopG/Arc/MetJ family transcriptional regulator